MKHLLLASLVALVLFVWAGVTPPAPVQAATGGCSDPYSVDPGPFKITTMTMVNMAAGYADIPLDPEVWTPSCMTVEATGVEFFAQVTCSFTNNAGVGRNYRIWAGVFMDGYLHGEATVMYIPESSWDYETVQAGSLLERLPQTNTYGVHTFDVRFWGIQGSAAIQECNLNVWSFPGVTS